MRAEYEKVIESFYWACKANKQMICNDAVADDVLASVKDPLCKAWKLKTKWKRECRPDYPSTRTTSSPTESLRCGIIQKP